MSNFESPSLLEKKITSPIQWVRPDTKLEFELGEIERVSRHFGETPEEQSRIINRLTEGIAQVEPVDLTPDLWENLENTDSFDIAAGDYARVRVLAQEYGRNEGHIIDQVNSGIPIETPIIAQRGEALHLVSGNTRLMLARAAGQIPKVIIVQIAGK
ncbi:MAG: hypothetical protein ACEQSB_03740 [Undibacterium sp.]